MSNFLSKLNTRQLVIHFIAFWLFIYAFHTLAYLYDYKILTSDSVKVYQVIFKARYATDLAIIDIAGSIGLFIAFVISWRLSDLNKWFWPIPVIVFFITFLLYYFNLLGWSKLQYIFLAPGQIFSGLSNAITIIFNGIIMLAMGLYLFLSKKVIGYISRRMK